MSQIQQQMVVVAQDSEFRSAHDSLISNSSSSSGQQQPLINQNYKSQSEKGNLAPLDVSMPLQESFPNPIRNNDSTILMAVLTSMQHLPQGATVRDCVQFFLKKKIGEMDDVKATMSMAFNQRLRVLEDGLIGGESVPVNSEDI